MLENLHKIGLTSIERAPVTQPNIYSLGQKFKESLFTIAYLDPSKLARLSSNEVFDGMR